MIFKPSFASFSRKRRATLLRKPLPSPSSSARSSPKSATNGRPTPDLQAARTSTSVKRIRTSQRANKIPARKMRLSTPLRKVVGTKIPKILKYWMILRTRKRTSLKSSRSLRKNSKRRFSQSHIPSRTTWRPSKWNSKQSSLRLLSTRATREVSASSSTTLPKLSSTWRRTSTTYPRVPSPYPSFSALVTEHWLPKPTGTFSQTGEIFWLSSPLTTPNVRPTFYQQSWRIWRPNKVTFQKSKH